jgi:hypothetical protein
MQRLSTRSGTINGFPAGVEEAFFNSDSNVLP